jgi:3-hydroxyisobutyrate dehydrogenase
MSKIGFIGLGHMGAPIATNLLQAGHTLRVYDINPAAVLALKTAGAEVAETVAEVAKEAEVIITMLQTGDQVAGVCLGAQGLFANASPGTLFIDSSSIDVETCRDLHHQARAQGFVMVDAPVSGGVAGASAGTLTIMVGGAQDDFQRAHSILQGYGKTIIHAGAAGNGQVAKICNNLILGISMIAVSEAFTLGERLGLPAETLFAISSQASGQCWAMTRYSPVPGLVEGVPSNHAYRPGFTANMMLKDLNLSQKGARLANMETPLGARARDLYQQFVARGDGELDFSGIIKLLDGKREGESD